MAKISYLCRAPISLLFELSVGGTHASVKSPTPATMQILAWNRLETGNKDGAVYVLEEGHAREFGIIHFRQCSATAVV